MLRLLWLSFRFFCLMTTVCNWAIAIFRLACKGSECVIPFADYYSTGACFLFVALASTPDNRGRVTRWLGSLGKNGPAEQQAASVASLLGDTSASKALANATKRFRAQPLSTLTREALMNNESDPSLHALTVPATLGKVDGFLSHSWCAPRRSKPSVPQYQ